MSKIPYEDKVVTRKYEPYNIEHGDVCVISKNDILYLGEFLSPTQSLPRGGFILTNGKLVSYEKEDSCAVMCGKKIGKI